MNGFIDVSCPKCGRRFGFQGSIINRPPCPKCGHQLPAAELQAAEDKINRIETLLLTHPSQETCGEQRVLAGLDLRQAAARLDLHPRDLADIEHGRAPLTDEIAAKMATLYNCG